MKGTFFPFFPSSPPLLPFFSKDWVQKTERSEVSWGWEIFPKFLTQKVLFFRKNKNRHSPSIWDFWKSSKFSLGLTASDFSRDDEYRPARARKNALFIFIAYSDSSHQDVHAHKIWAPGDHGVKRYSEYKIIFQFFPKFWKNTMKFT